MNVIETFLFPVLQKFLRNDFYSKYRFLERAESFSPERRREWHLAQLRKIISHAYESVPFYRRRYDEAGISPTDLKSPKDLCRFPVVRKSDFMMSTDSCVSRLSTHQIQNATSGSTGTPFQFVMDLELRGWKAARYFYLMKQAGLDVGRPYMKIWGAGKVQTGQKTFTRHILRRTDVDSFGLDNKMKKEIIALIRRKKPYLIEAYASSMAAVAEYTSCPTVPVIITSAETLYPHQRDHIGRAFQARVLNRYGSREFGNIAQEQNDEGMLRVLDLNFRIESLDGRLLITCFDNYAMPFIRYDIGDLGMVREIGGATFISKLEGRTSQMFRTRGGKQISPVFFSYAIGGCHGRHIEKFQVTYLAGKIVAAIVPRASFSAEMQSSIRDHLQASLDDTEIEIRLVQTLETQTSTGKSKLIIPYPGINGDPG